MEISQVFGGDSLKAADLKGKEPTLTISQIEMKRFDNGNKLVVRFAETKKTLVCNKTNAARIARFYGTNTDLWYGQKIQLYTDLVDFQGSVVEAIRVRAPRSAQSEVQQHPQPAAQQRPPVHVPQHGPMGPEPPLNDEIPF